MLDLFTIFTKGGMVLWYFQGTAFSLAQAVNGLVKAVILQVGQVIVVPVFCPLFDVTSSRHRNGSASIPTHMTL